MAIQNINNLILTSEPFYANDITVVTINAAGRSGAVIGQVVIQGNGSNKVISAGLGKILWYPLGTTFVAVGTTLRIGIQDVDLATGLEDLTYDVRKEYVAGTDIITANALNLAVMDTGNKTLSDGDLIAIVITMPARAGADSVAINGCQSNHIMLTDANLGFPYGTTNTGVLTKSNTTFVYAIIVFDDGTLGWIVSTNPVSWSAGVSTISFNSGSSPDEYIGTFTPNYTMQVSYIAPSISGIATTDNFEVILYSDPYGTPTVIATIVPDPDVVSGVVAAGAPHFYKIPPITLVSGTTYGIAVRPTTVNNINWNYAALTSSATAEIVKGIQPLPSLKMAGRTNQVGAFVETSGAHLPLVAINVCGLDDGIGSATDTSKILGQNQPLPNTLTAVYTAPPGKTVVSSSITVCNTGPYVDYISISIAQSGAADNPKQYQYYNHELAPYSTFVATIGVTMSSNDVIRCKSTTGMTAFTALGLEIQ
jgi:hypothetical protein